MRRSTDFRFKYNTIPRALLTISYVSYIRECMRVNKIFLDGKKGRDLWIKRKHARDFAFTMSRENITIRRWDLMEKYAGMAFMSIGTWYFAHGIDIDFYFGLTTHIYFSYTCSLLIHNVAFAHDLLIDICTFELILVFKNIWLKSRLYHKFIILWEHYGI